MFNRSSSKLPNSIALDTPVRKYLCQVRNRNIDNSATGQLIGSLSHGLAGFDKFHVVQDVTHQQYHHLYICHWYFLAVRWIQLSERHFLITACYRIAQPRTLFSSGHDWPGVCAGLLCVRAEHLHPWNLTWNLKIMVSKRTFLFQWLIFRFHVKFQGSKKNKRCCWWWTCCTSW